MEQDLKFIVLNDHEECAVELRAMIQKFDGVKIVAEVSEPALLAQAVSQFPVDILFVNLDPHPEAILPLIGDVAKAHRNLVIFAASESSDGPLILKVMRLGVKEFLPKPMDESALGEAIHRVASHRVETVTQGKLITVLGTAGGVGATMLATNLGVELADDGEAKSELDISINEDDEDDHTVFVPRSADTQQQSAEDEIATKLDLAKAYVELGDKDSARGMLEEIIQEGNPQQKATAKELLQQVK